MNAPNPRHAAGVRPELDKEQRRQATVFLAVGIATVAIDALVYALLCALSVPPNWAKGSSFLAGTLFAWHANKTLTFRAAPERSGIARKLRFMALYATTLSANVLANAAVLAVGDWIGAPLWLGAPFAFLCATAISAVSNFLGMRLWVFAAK